MVANKIVLDVSRLKIIDDNPALPRLTIRAIENLTLRINGGLAINGGDILEPETWNFNLDCDVSIGGSTKNTDWLAKVVLGE